MTDQPTPQPDPTPDTEQTSESQTQDLMVAALLRERERYAQRGLTKESVT
ncbi:hypothetical protein SMC26_08845 [Actinomadura fulvescens]|uniref:Uncharacterized protein n=1 Tax=Actinomadura fulvescens TaxID=46160 RepID=A0ABN3QU93_9ACTN